MHVSPKKMELFKATAKHRWEREQEQLASSFGQKWSLAKKAADMLKEKFGVHQVIVFGSITQKELYHLHSDLDLAVRGLDEKNYFRAVAKLLELDPLNKMDLVRIEDASDSLRSVIEKEGVLL